MNDNLKTIASFILRMGMYIYPIDKNNAISFLTGFEIDKEFFFSTKIKTYLEERGILSNSLGMRGQIQQYADDKHLDWLTAFIQISLEIIASEEKDMLKDLKLTNRIKGIIHRIESPVANSWIQEWLAFCNSDKKWFQDLWKESEWSIIRSISLKVETYRNGKCNHQELSETLAGLKKLFNT